MGRQLKRWWPVLALAGLIAYPWLVQASYFHNLGFNVLLFAVMATSWNIMGGFSGYKSLGHSAFYGLGAYMVAIAANQLGWNPFFSAPVLAIFVAIVAMLLGWAMLRTHGSAFVIATIAMLLIFRILANNLKDITNGAGGLSQPLPLFPPEHYWVPFYYYMLVWLIIAIAASAFIRRSRFGMGLLAIRDDEGKAEMVGVNTTLYKVIAFGISAYFVGVGGGIWSYGTSHISPVFAFDIVVGVEMIIMTMLGGMGTIWGPALGAFILIPAEEGIRIVFGSTPIHLSILGGVMIAIILFMPRGILPTLGDWLSARRTPQWAHEGAQSMEELRRKQSGDAPAEEPDPTIELEAP